MRGTVSRNLTFQDVFVTDDEQLMPRGVYYKGAQTWPAMFFTLAPTYLGSPTRPTTSPCSTCAARCRASRR